MYRVLFASCARIAPGPALPWTIRVRLLSSARPSQSRNPLLPFSARLYEALKLKTFSREEISLAFAKLDTDADGRLVRREIEHLLGPELTEEFAQHFMTMSEEHGETVTKEAFVDGILRLAEQVDPRVFTLAVSMLFTGTAVGLVVPVLPKFVNQGLGLSTSHFGLIIGAFALTKLFGNVPAAIAADLRGRKPLLTGGMALVGVSMLGLAFVTSLEQLIGMRMLCGLGVAAFTTGSTLYLADLSTPLNRARTMAPILAAFSAGSTVGPALGGVLADTVGVQACFTLTGLGFLALAAFGHVKLVETLPLALRSRSNIGKASLEAVKSWGPLLKDPQLRAVFAVNAAYWVAVAGAQLTLLPVLLSQQGYAAAHIGGIFAAMSAVVVVGSQPAAVMADKIGKVPVICGACVMCAAGMASFPQEAAYPVLSLGLWAAGITLLGTSPTALVTDIAGLRSRSQAIALFRTVGDVGLLLGAATGGYMADHTSIATAMQADAALLLATSTVFGLNAFRHRRRA